MPGYKGQFLSFNEKLIWMIDRLGAVDTKIIFRTLLYSKQGLNLSPITRFGGALHYTTAQLMNRVHGSWTWIPTLPVQSISRAKSGQPSSHVKTSLPGPKARRVGHTVTYSFELRRLPLAFLLHGSQYGRFGNSCTKWHLDSLHHRLVNFKCRKVASRPGQV